MDFTDIETELSLEMEKDINERNLKQKKKEEEYLLNIKNEKIKQDEIKQKQFEDTIKKKELAIKTYKDVEIKTNLNNALLLQKQQLTSEYANAKRQIINDYENKIKEIKTELFNVKLQLTCAYSQLEKYTEKKMC